MVKVCVMQTDNRPTLNYLLLTQEINKKFCDILGYTYLFIPMNDNKIGKLHPATKKILVVNEFLQKTNYDILVFLDSDAWIQDGNHLNTIITNLENSPKQGAFSRDPYVDFNTYINSGSFILKINNMTKQMYSIIINNLRIDNRYHDKWPFDQQYISDFVFKNRNNFTIFVPDILNTPKGKVLRHNWGKCQKMYRDLSELKKKLIIDNTWSSDIPFIETEYYCDQPFPNTIKNGYHYND
jgi:hypothetical protein